MANKMIMTITISFEAKQKLESLASDAGKSMSQFIEDLITKSDVEISIPVSTETVESSKEA